MRNRQFKAQVSRREPKRPQALGFPPPLQAEDTPEPSRLDHFHRAERLLYWLTVCWIALVALIGLTLLWWFVG